VSARIPESRAALLPRNARGLREVLHETSGRSSCTRYQPATPCLSPFFVRETTPFLPPDMHLSRLDREGGTTNRETRKLVRRETRGYRKIWRDSRPTGSPEVRRAPGCALHRRSGEQRRFVVVSRRAAMHPTTLVG